ncbi:Uncharacterised protein [Salmonella enterica subsp. enterica]|uniref:Uncharacterized protein n=1 Tax=Salmonella enterica I TaxID=59201 RepID=A0A379WZA7_SALET|nr:Uncharacterised protein [Salmonella enterica subsp. enterica]
MHFHKRTLLSVATLGMLAVSVVLDGSLGTKQ